MVFIDYMYSTIDIIVYWLFNEAFLSITLTLKNQFTKCALLTIHIVFLAKLIINRVTCYDVLLSQWRNNLVQQMVFIDYTYSTINARMYIDRSTELPLLFRYHCDSTDQFTKCTFLTIRIILLAQLIIDTLWLMV